MVYRPLNKEREGALSIVYWRYLAKWENSPKIAIKQKNRSISYSELYEKSTLAARQIQKEKKPNIGIYLPNSIDYAISYFGITLAKKCIVPIPIEFTIKEIRDTVLHCELSAIITNLANLEKLKPLKMAFPQSLRILTIEDLLSNNNISEQENNIPLASESSEHDVAIMLCSSGTTGSSKRVMLTHHNLITNIKSNILSLSFNQDDITLIVLPMYFGYCNTAQFLTHLYVGATIVINEPPFTPQSLLSTIQKEKITNFTAVPSILVMLMQFKRKDQYDLHSLKMVCFGGGIIAEEIIKGLIEAFPTVGFVHTYGLTEASPRLTCLLPSDALRKIGSVGKPIPFVQVKVVDENGKEKKIGEVGEIIAFGENIMKGYYKDEEATRKAIRNGWLYTGDLGYFDEEGYLYIVGRKKNIIISKSINILPEEIEKVLLNHPLVKEVCVTSEPDEVLGEAVIAKVVPSSSMPSTEIENILEDYCRENLATFKIPKRIDIVPSLDKTYTGKIKRNYNERR
ncbi:long-chain-fatty-acid--CoA ligase LcfB [Thermoanaerobacter kivui]|uniref:Long-chain-fatty-acid--CoA ligase LcfB n=1 Tax=Thermoanaerobacter kivui TaxID=2325 RepID=A0A097AQR3_THEKI|nr:long-chain-fatty-acid--CoA ligase LcfB [Thermoanaerobacter kivui]